MNSPRRYLRLAFTFLALMIVTLLTTMTLDFSTAARVGSVVEVAAKQAPHNASASEYQAYLEGLPRPSGWVSYGIFIVDPQTPWLRVQEVATVENTSWSQPLNRLLNHFGVLDASGGGLTLISTGEMRYQLTYTRMRPGPLPFFLSMGFWLAFWTMLALWLYEDAKVRLGKQAVPWLLLGLLGGPIAIAVWLIQRPSPPPPPPVCPACQTTQVEDATYCVSCGSHLKPTCSECGRAIERGWHHCPTCGNHLTSESA